MGYFLQALIYKLQPLKNKAKSFSSEHRVNLAQEFTMIPVTEKLHEEVADKYLCDKETPYGRLMLSGDLVEWIKELSELTPIAYLEAEYFGGVGGQGAIVWDEGNVVLGPLWSADIGPINKALELLGAQTAAGALDEFASVGLDRERDTNDWIK